MSESISAAEQVPSRRNSCESWTYARFRSGPRPLAPLSRHMVETKQAMEPEGYLFRLFHLCRPPRPDQTCTCPRPPMGTFALCRCFDGSGNPSFADEDEA